MISGCPPVTLSSVGTHCNHRVHAQFVRPVGHAVCRRHLRLRHSSKTVSPVAAVNKDEGQLTVQSPVAALKRLQSRLRGAENGAKSRRPLSQLMCVCVLCLVFRQCKLQPQSAFTWCTVGAVDHVPAEEAAAPDYKVVVALCAAVSLICSIDRASISVAIVPMAEQYGWSDSVKGAISSSFFLGYTITNLIGTTISLQCKHLSSCPMPHRAALCANLPAATYTKHLTLQSQTHATSCLPQCTSYEGCLMQAGMWPQSTLLRWYWEGAWCYGPCSQSSPQQQPTWASCWCPSCSPGASWELAKEWLFLPSRTCFPSTFSNTHFV